MKTEIWEKVNFCPEEIEGKYQQDPMRGFGGETFCHIRGLAW